MQGKALRKASLHQVRMTHTDSKGEREGEDIYIYVYIDCVSDDTILMLIATS